MFSRKYRRAVPPHSVAGNPRPQGREVGTYQRYVHGNACGGDVCKECLKDKLSGVYATNMDNPVRVPIGTKCGECVRARNTPPLCFVEI